MAISIIPKVQSQFQTMEQDVKNIKGDLANTEMVINDIKNSLNDISTTIEEDKSNFESFTIETKDKLEELNTNIKDLYFKINKINLEISQRLLDQHKTNNRITTWLAFATAFGVAALFFIFKFIQTGTMI